ncbi:glycosyltransferase involved in cell wall biosynthesis [Flavobacterium sp. 7E]|uniref:glycosyltransferase n=1 Tax=Flavobacterium sp. 7E TaxID=2735898 RepID=UPI001570EF08|nr:glycosyltransferase [Flavobacterium sp. 7E]NRS89391.1 glycosyltransferase involved in cell wall biosynthesis [Flavobacterium sp. 7E]
MQTYTVIDESNIAPVVSIAMVTYNHSKYIAEAIDSVLMQQTTFNYKIVIAEDCSTDNTRAIILDYQKNYPDKIKLILQNKNIGASRNNLTLLTNLEGKYIAALEGDDYWTDPLKLQKQVDFLEANPEYVLCFHQVDILKTDGTIVDDFITVVPENYETIETLARLGNYIHTPSVIFKNVIEKYPFEFELSPIGDYFLYMLLAEHGKLKHLEEKMAVYRQGVGVWSKEGDYFKNFNTAYLHALLTNYFVNNSSIVYIFTQRIKEFLNCFESSITADELVQLSLNDTLKKEVFNVLLEKNIALKKELLFNKSTKNGPAIFFQRIKNRIWK